MPGIHNCHLRHCSCTFQAFTLHRFLQVKDRAVKTLGMDYFSRGGKSASRQRYLCGRGPVQWGAAGLWIGHVELFTRPAEQLRETPAGGQATHIGQTQQVTCRSYYKLIFFHVSNIRVTEMVTINYIIYIYYDFN